MLDSTTSRPLLEHSHQRPKVRQMLMAVSGGQQPRCRIGDLIDEPHIPLVVHLRRHKLEYAVRRKAMCMRTPGKGK